ncbi:MAG: hypothetical protein AAF530_06160 [Pseudomonadota bacterium]
MRKQHAKFFWMILVSSITVIWVAAYPTWAVAKTFRPLDDSAVLAHLPGSSDVQVEEFKRAQRYSFALPNDLGLAIQSAKLAIELAQERADPRFMGYAQTALRPWWELSDPPSQVVLLRAIIHQLNHQFERSLEDLEKVISRSPDHAQAWLTRAFVLQALGRPHQALESCQFLGHQLGRLIAAICQSRMEFLIGESEMAYESLRRALSEKSVASARTRSWAYTVLAEIAAGIGQANAAERHFREALALNEQNTYLLASFSDFLLGQGRASEVRDLLEGKTAADSLLLRLAIAATKLETDDATQLESLLVARFRESWLRQDARHLREEAIFANHSANRPAEALELALANWQSQREPIDARVLLMAARNANSPQAAEPVREWMRATGIQDVSLSALINDIDEGGE